MTSYKKRQREVRNRPFPKKAAFKLLVMMAIVTGVTLAQRLLEPGVNEADVVVYQSNKCSCVSDWIGHLKNEGYSVAIRKVMFVSAIRKEYSIPEEFSSCHTTIAGQYFIEGHVPIDSVNALFLTQPNIAGIALPGKTDKSKPDEIEMGLPEEVVAIDFEGRQRAYKPD